MIELLTPEFEHIDERGSLTQLVSDGYKQVNVIYTNAGCRRGRMHFHRENVEAFYVISGRLNLIVSDKTYSFAKGDMFRIPPGVGHSLDFVEDTLLVSMYSLGVDLPDGTRDIVEI